MNKSDITEIKKQFKKDNNIIGKILTCYVDGEKNIKMIKKESFVSLKEEEAFKYQEIFKQSLSKTLGKNLLNLELDIYNNKENLDILLKLKDTKLEDDKLVEEFINKIIKNYNCNENYLIILTNITYDIPKKTKDNLVLEDASDEVYNAILCSICPIKLDKAYLRYNPNTQSFENKMRDLVVEAPLKSFLYPSFNNRAMDIHEALYFSKNADEIDEDFIFNIFSVKAPLSQKEQKENFKNIGSNLDMKLTNMTKIHEEISEIIKEHDETSGPVVLDKQEIYKILEKSDIEEEALEMFDKNTDSDIKLLATNIIDTKKIELKKAGINIKISSECMHLLQTKYIDNKKCIVIEVDDNIEINGVLVKTL